MPRSHPRAGAVQGPAGDNRAMLQAAMVTARLAVFVLVGTLIFLAPWPGAGYRSVEIAAFALAGVVLVCWAVAGGVPAVRDRLSPLQPYAFGLVAVTCAAVSALPGGGSLIALSVIMVIAVGSGPSLTVAWIVTGLSVAAVELAGPTLRGSGWKTAAYPAAALLLALLIGLTRRAHRIQAEVSGPGRQVGAAPRGTGQDSDAGRARPHCPRDPRRSRARARRPGGAHPACSGRAH